MNFKVKGALTNQIKFNFGAISNSAKGLVVVIISLALACMLWSQRIINKYLINENAELLFAVLNIMDNTLIDNYKNNKVRPITSLATNSLFTGAKMNHH